MIMEKYVYCQLDLSLWLAHDQLAKIVNFSLLISKPVNILKCNLHTQKSSFFLRVWNGPHTPKIWDKVLFREASLHWEQLRLCLQGHSARRQTGLHVPMPAPGNFHTNSTFYANRLPSPAPSFPVSESPGPVSSLASCLQAAYNVGTSIYFWTMCEKRRAESKVRE